MSVHPFILFDTHAHADAFSAIQWREVCGRAQQRGVRGCLSAGVWWDSFERLLSDFASDVIARCDGRDSFEQALLHLNGFAILPALGLHPMEIARRWRAADGSFDETQAIFDAQQMRRVAERFKKWIWAIGETGFDANKNMLEGWLSKQELLRAQQFAFLECSQLSAELRLPLVIHSRSAWQQTRTSIESALAAGVPKFMIHCYGGPAEDVYWLAKLGGFASFGGVLTWPDARRVRQAFVNCPAAAILFETDSPDLSPLLADGGRPDMNEPVFLTDVIAEAAVIRGVSSDELAELNWKNFCEFLF
ncbi:MAG: hypothetical protein RLZZ488_2215 [Pseudomonadota bacterium]|jgi:TatD family hydrolase